MNTKQLVYVLTLARCGSFSKAAAELDISQPSLSQYIKKIEEDAGTELFERVGGFIRMTDAGRVYAETGRQILELEHDMHNRFSDIANNNGGTLVIGISAHRSACLMPSILAAYREKYPGICVVLKEYSRDELVERAEHGEFDLCITTTPVNEKLFEVMACFEEEILLAVSEGSALCAELVSAFPEGKADIHRLNGCDFAMLNDAHPMQRQLREICDEFSLELHKTVECTSLETMVSMVGENMGAALVPACLKTLGGKSIRFFRIAQPIPKRNIVLIHRRGQYLPDKASVMSAVIADKLTDYFR